MPIRDQQKRREYFKKWQKARREAAQTAPRAYKLKMGCADCGYSVHHAALEFDHLPGSIKVATVGSMAGSGSKDGLSGAMWDELLKCDVVCSNCHAIRTHNRLGD